MSIEIGGRIPGAQCRAGFSVLLGRGDLSARVAAARSTAELPPTPTAVGCATVGPTGPITAVVSYTAVVVILLLLLSFDRPATTLRTRYNLLITARTRARALLDPVSCLSDVLQRTCRQQHPDRHHRGTTVFVLSPFYNRHVPTTVVNVLRRSSFNRRRVTIVVRNPPDPLIALGYFHIAY